MIFLCFSWVLLVFCYILLYFRRFLHPGDPVNTVVHQQEYLDSRPEVVDIGLDPKLVEKAKLRTDLVARGP